MGDCENYDYNETDASVPAHLENWYSDEYNEDDKYLVLPYPIEYCPVYKNLFLNKLINKEEITLHTLYLLTKRYEKDYWNYRLANIFINSHGKHKKFHSMITKEHLIETINEMFDDDQESCQIFMLLIDEINPVAEITVNLIPDDPKPTQEFQKFLTCKKKISIDKFFKSCDLKEECYEGFWVYKESKEKLLESFDGDSLIIKYEKPETNLDSRESKKEWGNDWEFLFNTREDIHLQKSTTEFISDEQLSKLIQIFSDKKGMGTSKKGISKIKKQIKNFLEDSQ